MDTSYNTRQMTSECIDSVIEKTAGISYEIILVDNASTDGSREFFSKDKRVKYIYNNDNIGFGRANNEGLKIATGRNVLFLNSDTLLRNNAIKILSDYLDSHKKVGACGGNLFNADGTPGNSYRMYGPSIYAEVSRFFKYIPDKLFWGNNLWFNHSGKPKKVFFIWGADLMVKREVINDVGIFDPSFFMYYEDDELCNRIGKKYKVMSVPSAEIIHILGASSESNADKDAFRRDMHEQSLRNYLSVAHSKRYVRIMKIIRAITLATRIHKS